MGIAASWTAAQALLASSVISAGVAAYQVHEAKKNRPGTPPKPIAPTAASRGVAPKPSAPAAAPKSPTGPESATAYGHRRNRRLAGGGSGAAIRKPSLG